jgi:Putative Flp pilus-assembly TadE/G-like
MNRLRNERGQTMVLTTLFVAALLGMAALVVDLGTWFRDQRDLQAVADAAALAGAQELPEDTSLARSRAIDYTTKNGGASPGITFTSTLGSGLDTIRVELQRPAPGFFAKVFGVNSVEIRAHAVARASYPSKFRWVAPITVNEKHPMLNCNPPPSCWNPANETWIDLEHLHKPGSGDASGSFALLSLNNGDVDANTLADWLLNGYDEYIGPGDFRSAPSANFNNGQFQSALEQRKGTEMLFPIYRKITGSGSTADYEIVGFVGFVVLEVKGGGAEQRLRGYFTRVVWDGIPAETKPGTDFGVRTIELIE